MILGVGRIHPLQYSLCWAENHEQSKESLCAQSGEEPHAITLPAAGQWPHQLLGPPFAWPLLLSHLLLCFPMLATWSWRPKVTDICLFCFLFSPHSTDAGDSPVGTTTTTNLEQPQVIPSQGDLLGDLLNLDLGPPVNVPQVSSMQMGAVDLLGGGLDSLVSSTSSLADGR